MISKNILYISYDGMTDPLGQSQVIPYLQGLTKLGYKFTILSAEKQQRFQENRDRIETLLSSSSIEWAPLIYTKNPPILSTLYDFFSMRRKAKKLNAIQHFEGVHCRSYLPALIGLEMKRKFGTRLIFDMRGFWADERVDGKIWNLANPIYKLIYQFFKRKEKELLKEADYTISLTYNGETEIKSWTHIHQPVKMAIIPCCADLTHFSPANINLNLKNQFISELNIQPNDYIISYLGSIGTWYMLDEMLQFFKTLLKTKPTARFLFITHDEHESIRSKARGIGIADDCIIIRGAQRNEIPTLLSLCQFSIFFIRATYSKKSSSPTKQGEIMGMGIPVICNEGVGDTDAIVSKYESGMVISSFDENAYHQAILQLENKLFSKEKIREGALDYFSLEKGIEKYAAVYSAVFK